MLKFEAEGLKFQELDLVLRLNNDYCMFCACSKANSNRKNRINNFYNM